MLGPVMYIDSFMNRFPLWLTHLPLQNFQVPWVLLPTCDMGLIDLDANIGHSDLVSFGWIYEVLPQACNLVRKEQHFQCEVLTLYKYVCLSVCPSWDDITSTPSWD